MIFCKVVEKNAQVIKSLLQEYGQKFGQHVNPTKCKPYGAGTSGCRLRHNANILGFIVAHTPFNYLRLSIFKGKLITHDLQIMADRVLTKLATWNGHFISMIGTVQLVHYVIQDMLLYSLRIYE